MSGAAACLARHLVVLAEIERKDVRVLERLAALAEHHQRLRQELRPSTKVAPRPAPDLDVLPCACGHGALPLLHLRVDPRHQLALQPLALLVVLVPAPDGRGTCCRARTVQSRTDSAPAPRGSCPVRRAPPRPPWPRSCNSVCLPVRVAMGAPAAVVPRRAVRLPRSKAHPAELVLQRLSSKSSSHARTLQAPVRQTMWLQPPFFSIVAWHLGHSFVLAWIQFAVCSVRERRPARAHTPPRCRRHTSSARLPASRTCQGSQCHQCTAGEGGRT